LVPAATVHASDATKIQELLFPWKLSGMKGYHKSYIKQSVLTNSLCETTTGFSNSMLEVRTSIHPVYQEQVMKNNKATSFSIM